MKHTMFIVSTHTLGEHIREYGEDHKTVLTVPDTVLFHLHLFMGIGTHTYPAIHILTSNRIHMDLLIQMPDVCVADV